MGANEHQQLSVSLTMTPEIMSALAAESGALEIARTFCIDSAEMAAAANTELRSIKARMAKIRELRTGFVSPAKQIIANAEALFDPPLEVLAGAEAHIKGLLTAWTQEQERIAAEARRRAEEEARRLREEAAREAAAQRARAEEASRKAREEAAAAETARRRAEEEARAARESGDRRAAAEAERRAQAAAAERAKRDEEERQRVAAAEAQARDIELRAAAEAQAAESAARAASPSAVAPAGFSLRDNWIAELEPGKTEQDAIRLIAAALATRPELIGLLRLDTGAASKMAKALKGVFNVPGLRAVNRPVAASRRA